MNEGIKRTPKAIAKQKGYYRPRRHSDEIADINGLDWVRHNNLPEAPLDLTEAAKEVWNY